MEKRQKARFRRIGATNQYETLPHLPQEIMACLPVESLLRFKSLKTVVSAYLQQQLHQNPSREIVKEQIFGAPPRDPRKLYREGEPMLLALFSADPLATAVGFDYPMCGSRESAYIVGSCNGLVCFLKNDKDFILWNPCIRKFKKLPSFDDDTRGKFVYAYGFGFDESNDDYKVFCKWTELTHDEEEGDGRKDQAITYSLKMGSWRKVENPMIDPDSRLQCKGTLVSGKLHWRAHSTVSFDLEKETFGTVEWPGDNENVFLADAIDGCLCCICPSKSYDEADYWILKEYGAKDSWHKLATLDRFDYNSVWYDPGEYYHPMIAGANGEIIFWNADSEFILFREEDGVLSRSGAVGTLHLPQYPPAIYVESLVEP